MKKEHFKYPSQDGKTMIHAIRWIPDGMVRGILQISHGMVEYIDRYDEFASYLTNRGFLVVGNDHLGHGQSVQSPEYHGYFAEKDGNRTVLRDIHHLRCLTEKAYPGVPYFLLGHSMGSFLARQYICKKGEGLAGAVIMGTGDQPGIATAAGMMVTKILAKFKGWHYRSLLVDGMAFGGYNRKFGAVEGKEWLSRNPDNVADYVKDEWCSFRFTLNGYYNLFYSIHCLSKAQYLNTMPRELPVFFVAGADDPVGDFGKGVRRVYQRFCRLGMRNVSIKLYPEDRHEILNEIDRQKVYEDIALWMEELL